MAEINDAFNNVTKEQSFFVPGKEKKEKFVPFAKGEYFGHITECEDKIVEFENSGNKYKASLYTYVFQASEENKSKSFNYIDLNGEKVMTSGEPYIGRTFRGKVWRFLEPSEGDDFVSNSEGNSGYLRFCESIGIECPVAKRVVDGNEIEVQLLPDLKTRDMEGKAGIAFVDQGRKWTDKEGKTRQYWDAKFIKKWEEGKNKTITKDSNEIPF